MPNNTKKKKKKYLINMIKGKQGFHDNTQCVLVLLNYILVTLQKDECSCN